MKTVDGNGVVVRAIDKVVLRGTGLLSAASDHQAQRVQRKAPDYVVQAHTAE